MQSKETEKLTFDVTAIHTEWQDCKALRAVSVDMVPQPCGPLVSHDF